MLAPTHYEFDISRSPETLYRFVRDAGSQPPSVVIHCAAIADWRACHDEPRKALEVNALGALNVERLCVELDAHMVYISTDAVFAGTPRAGGYTEADAPTRPVSIYGATKLAGEHLVAQTCHSLIVRVGWLFSSNPATDKKFIGQVLERATRSQKVYAVTDRSGSPAYAPHVAAKIIDLAEQRTSGIRHVANRGTVTRYEFALHVLGMFGYGACVRPATSEAFPDPVRRPDYSGLATTYADAQLPPWQQAIQELVAVNPRLRAR